MKKEIMNLKKEWGGQMGQLGKEKEEENYIILL